jgi:endonuclease YncB( thermonuclease family)
MRSFLWGSLLGLAVLLLPAVLAAAELKGTVVGITDGDTLTLLTADRKQKKIRLAEIDTPERHQPYGTKARQALADLAFRRKVQVIVEDTDRYGRTVGHIQVGSRDVNAEMVRRGAAWVDRRYSDDPALMRAEDEARAAKRGLWSLPEAERMPPWEWRKRTRPVPRGIATPVRRPRAEPVRAPASR